MFHKALVALDGSDLSDRILDYGHRLLERPGSEVVLLRVLPGGSPAGATEEARAHLERAAVRLRAGGATVETRVTSGDPAQQILESADEEECSWVLMATHGRSGISRWIKGSVAEGVLHGSRTPILVANPSAFEANAELTIRRILVPLDGSERSAQIVPFVDELAGHYRATVILQTVLDDPNDAASLEGDVRATAQASLEAQARRLPGTKVEILLSRGAPGEAIVEAASAKKADLVALATHGFSGLARWAFGSVAEHVIRHGVTPLFAVRTVERAKGP